MSIERSAIAERTVSLLSSGSVLAALGVLSFSLSFPGTVFALDGFGPWSATGVRGLIAAVLAGGSLLIARVRLPDRSDWTALAVVAGGCAIGFPLLTTLALQTSSSAHSAVVIGALPMATAIIFAALNRRREPLLFWVAAALGGATIVTFALLQNNGRPTIADLYLAAALVVCAAGYAEGGRLSAHLPGWQVIAWAVVVAAPINLAVAAWALPHESVHLTAKAVAGVAYIGAISQFGGFVVWYRGMGLIGVTKASQLQLAQPLLTVLWSMLLLGEHVGPAVPITAVIVLACIVVTQRAKRAERQAAQP